MERALEALQNGLLGVHMHQKNMQVMKVYALVHCITAKNYFTTWWNSEWKFSSNVTNKAFENLSKFLLLTWSFVPWPT